MSDIEKQQADKGKVEEEEKKQAEELSDDDLDNVAGGKKIKISTVTF